jgi:TusA-related sulfurtransferase
MPLTEQHIERYSRQILLPEIGGTGQQRILDSCVAVHGTGRMATVAARYLSAAGVGRLLTGTDVIDIEALHDLPRLDVVLACDLPSHVLAAMGEVMATRQVPTGQLLVAKHGVCTGGWVPFHPLAHELDHKLADTPCLPCTLGILDRAIDAVDETPVPGTIPDMIAGWIGTVLATEALKDILGIRRKEPCQGMRCHATSADAPYTPLPLPPTAGCPACGRLTDTIDITEERCPMTLVRVKLKLESMPHGSRLRIVLRGREPLESLPHALRHMGCASTPPRPVPTHPDTWMIDTRRQTV